MSTFPLSNLHFLDDIEPLSERKTTPTAAGQISNQSAANTATSTNRLTSATSNTLITTLVESSTLITSTQPANNEQQPSSSSSSVEFDENLDVLNEFEGSEPNSLRTVDYSYSENHADPNPAYQSVFTLSTAENGSIKSADQSNAERRKAHEKEIRRGDHFDFEFNEATFKPRPYRPKSAVKRRASSSDLSEETNQTNLNPVTDHKRPAPLSHRFWTEIEQEVLQEENEEGELKEESELKEENELKEESELIEESSRNRKDTSKSRESEEDGLDERVFDQSDLEKSELLSSEKEANEDAIRIDEESSREPVDEDALDGTENADLEHDSRDASVGDESMSSVNDDLRSNQRSISMLNELKSHINELLSARSESKADDRLIGELHEIKQIVGQSNLNRKLQKFRTELIDEFSQMLGSELNLQKQRNKLELSEFRLQLENLEQQFDKQLKSMERNLLDSLSKFVNRLPADSRDHQQVEQQLARLISDLEQFKSVSLADAKRRDRTLGELVAKLNLNELSSSIAGIRSRIDLISTNKKESKLTKSGEGAKSGRSIFSSDDEDSSIDEPADRKSDARLDTKLDEIKLLLNEIHNYQKIGSRKSLNEDGSKDGNKNGDKVGKKDDLLEENKRAQTSETFSDRARPPGSARTVRLKSPNDAQSSAEFTVERNETQMGLPLEERQEPTVECDLCEMTNSIRTNIRSFRSSFYRQKIKTYSACSYTSDFLDRLDQQIKLGDLNTEHDHVLPEWQSRIERDRLANGELEGRLNSRIRLFIHETSRDVRESVKQLKQLGNYNFDANETRAPSIPDDSHRLKQIQQMRFNINRRLIKLNAMIVNNY